jgi:hypothetical protein
LNKYRVAAKERLICLAIFSIGQPSKYRKRTASYCISGKDSMSLASTNDLEISQVADDFQRGPLAGNGASNKLLLGHTSHSLP